LPLRKRVFEWSVNMYVHVKNLLLNLLISDYSSLLCVLIVLLMHVLQ
jgi:hypothetical protein